MKQLLRKHASALAVIAVALSFTLFAWRSSSEVTNAVRTIREASPTGVLALLAVSLAAEAVLVYLFGSLLRRLGHRPGTRVVIQACVQRIALGTISPVPGPGPVAFTTYLRKHGVPTTDSLIALGLQSLVGNLSFCIFLVPVLGLIVAEGRASKAILVGAAALALVVCVFLIVAALLLRSAGPPSALARRIPARLQQPLTEARAHEIRPIDLLTALLLSFAVDVAGAGMLAISLRAVGFDVSPSTAATAYAVGTLFALIIPVFAGLLVVEVSAIVVLRGLGVPQEQAVAATILFRIGQVWFPFLIALMLSVGTYGQVRSSAYRVPAFVTLCSGVLGIASVIRPPARHLHSLGHYSAFGVPEISRSIVLASGLLLVFLSVQLWQRKRAAWVAACVVLLVATPAHLLRQHDRIGSVVYAVTFVLLVLNVRRFNVRGHIPSVRESLVQSSIVLGAVLAYGIVGFWVLDERVLGREFGLVDSLTSTLRTFALLGAPGLEPKTRYGHWFLDSIRTAGVLAVGLSAYSLSRPVLARRRPRESERNRARDLILAAGHSSLDAFKYSRDKYFFFSTDGRGVVSYGLYRGTAISLGDPVAQDEQSVGALICDFVAYCERSGWRAAFHQVPASSLHLYEGAGVKWMKVGEEAVVDLDAFTLAGGAMKSLRATVNRLERDGYQFRYFEPPLSDEMVEALREISDEWLAIGHHRERHFTLGEFEDEYIRNSPVFAVVSAQEKVVAFANIVHDGVPGEATIDLMRRRTEPSGAMDYIFVRGFETLKEQGYRRFSLGMAPFANMQAEPDPTVAERLAGQLYEHGESLFAYKGLRSYKEKFHPRWEPMYLVYQNDVALPLVTLALTRLGE